MELRAREPQLKTPHAERHREAALGESCARRTLCKTQATIPPGTKTRPPAPGAAPVSPRARCEIFGYGRPGLRPAAFQRQADKEGAELVL